VPSRQRSEQNRRKLLRNHEILFSSGRVGGKSSATDQLPLSIILGPVSLDIIRGSCVPWALPQGQGQSLLICLRGEAFYSSHHVSFAFGPRATALVVSAHAGTLLVGPSGLVVKVTLPRGFHLEHLPHARFDHSRRLLTHLADLCLEDGERSLPHALAEPYGVLLVETVRADETQARLQDGTEHGQSMTRFALAKDYIRAHLFERIRLSDVAQALNVSARSVQLMFAQDAGESLTQYVTRLRLEEAHQRLLRGDVLTNVTQIAMDCGFNHAGMFSAAYRRAFGELPRDTLARARRDLQGDVTRDDLALTS